MLFQAVPSIKLRQRSIDMNIPEQDGANKYFREKPTRLRGNHNTRSMHSIDLNRVSHNLAGRKTRINRRTLCSLVPEVQNNLTERPAIYEETSKKPAQPPFLPARNPRQRTIEESDTMQLKENIIKGCIQQLQGVLQSIHVASRRKLVNRCIAYEDPEHDRTVIERHVANGGSQLRLNVSNKKTDVESQPFEAENRRINLQSKKVPVDIKKVQNRKNDFSNRTSRDSQRRYIKLEANFEQQQQVLSTKKALPCKSKQNIDKVGQKNKQKETTFPKGEQESAYKFETYVRNICRLKKQGMKIVMQKKQKHRPDISGIVRKDSENVMQAISTVHRKKQFEEIDFSAIDKVNQSSFISQFENKALMAELLRQPKIEHVEEGQEEREPKLLSSGLNEEAQLMKKIDENCICLTENAIGSELVTIDPHKILLKQRSTTLQDGTHSSRSLLSKPNKLTKLKNNKKLMNIFPCDFF